MPPEITSKRLDDLLVDPREDLALEVKNWLDLQGNNNEVITPLQQVKLDTLFW